MCDINVVSVDSRGMSSSTSEPEAFKEHRWTLGYFMQTIKNDHSIVGHKSTVAALCGLNLKVYFRKEHCALFNTHEINHAATLLTLDPNTGFPQHYIRGPAYVVMNGGIAPLSWNRVYGIVELIIDACDYYHFHPDHQNRGKQELMKLATNYRNKRFGPSSIYKDREQSKDDDLISKATLQRSNRRSREPFVAIQV
eukprot:CAMPEP_0178735222 /NCGR_PEP_ID=MMETSP0744-20121128/1770_1 /TAXON_ID=913974 /ORGANISM="Nitzschia punctata, Strain CCMP561" /LENGTH=195 /DNA_ID=CAMNT_0020387571 /DNA_START=12 /DNA_END=599 /DNA_ORIENTATION=-